MSPRKRKAPYCYLDHTADIGCEVSGKTRRQLFEHAGKALFSLIVSPDLIVEREEIPVVVSGMDTADLWVSFLRELLYLVNGTQFIGRSVVVTRMDNTSLTGVVRGEQLDLPRHRPLREVKAVTYHEAEVTRTPSGWRGRFICDI